ncbi:MAG: MFS transporter [Candidatus Dormiibacterota bacterium]
MASANARSSGKHSLRRVVASSAVGSAMEWYDFFLYTAAGALLFNRLFFPHLSPAVGTIAAMGTLAVGSFSRPIGGVVFGQLGDRFGRKPMLVVTILIMGVATALIGLLPTAATLGIWAPVALVVLRFAQGVGAGGEWGGSVLLVSEHTVPARRGYYSSMTQSGIAFGFLGATAIFALLTGVLSTPQFQAWGWRIPFLISVVLVGIGLYIRLGVGESPEFTRLKAQGREARVPIIDVLRRYPRGVVVTIGARIAETGSSTLVQIALLVLGVSVLHIKPTIALLALAIGFGVDMVTMVGFGRLTDRIGRRPVFLFGAAAMAILAFPFVWLIGTGAAALVILSVVLTYGIGHAGMIGAEPSFFSELFPTDVRYSGLAIGHEISGMVTGIIPLVVTTLVVVTKATSWPLAALLILLCLIGFVAVLWSSETAGHRAAPAPAEEPA